MPYLIITDKQHEIDRHNLTGPIVVGRSPECDVAVRDILLSRRHFSLALEKTGWIITDLGSKNGTFIEGRKLERQLLNDADVVRAGRTRFIFRAGAFIPPPPDVVERKAARRPVDPIEALSGTMLGFELTDLEENSRISGFPIPQPKAHAQPVKRLRVETELVKQPAVSVPDWDLTLRDTAPAPAAPQHVPKAIPATAPPVKVHEQQKMSVAPAPAIARQENPGEFATTPQWLALTYTLIAYLICALTLWLFSWQ